MPSSNSSSPRSPSTTDTSPATDSPGKMSRRPSVTGEGSSTASSNDSQPSAPSPTSLSSDSDRLNFSKKAISKSSTTSAFSSFSSSTNLAPRSSSRRPVASCSIHGANGATTNAGSNATAPMQPAEPNEASTAAPAAALSTSCECASPSQLESPPQTVVAVDTDAKIRTPASADVSRQVQIGAARNFTGVVVSQSPAPLAAAGTADSNTSKTPLTDPPRRSKATTGYQPAEVMLKRANDGTQPPAPTGQVVREFPFAAAARINQQRRAHWTPSLPSSPTRINTSPLSGSKTPLFSTNNSTTKLDDMFNNPPRRTFSSEDATQLAHQDPAAFKQLGNLKKTLFVPAVLRPNEQYQLNSPSDARFAWQSGVESPLRAPPRHHWKPDFERDSCKACDTRFTFIERRHHCRRCGDIFCSNDVKYTIYLDQALRFNPLGYTSKACRSCAVDYQEFKSSLNMAVSPPSKLNSPLTSETSSPDAKAKIPKQTPDLMLGLPQETVDPELLHVSRADLANEQPVGSVPADWAWSTF